MKYYSAKRYGTEKHEDKRLYCKSDPRDGGAAGTRRRRRRKRMGDGGGAFIHFTIHPYLNLARIQKPEQ